VIRAIAQQTDGLFCEDDFLPLPCAHPNCHSLAYAYRSGGSVVPLARLINAREHLDLLANGIMFTRARARELIEQFLGRLGCCAGGCGPETGSNGALVQLGAGRSVVGMHGINGQAAAVGSAKPQAVADEFFHRALTEQLSPADVFRITITSFLDAYNFDVRRVMKCCIHHVLPSGHVIPFCAYNVLYRDGHVALPLLRQIQPHLAPVAGQV
jgi:uncharacterized radical SAM superfamily Fe-S cluster-containing enzyme